MLNPNPPKLAPDGRPLSKPEGTQPWRRREKAGSDPRKAQRLAVIVDESFHRFLTAASALTAAETVLAVHALPAALQATAEEMLAKIRGAK